MRRLPGCRYGHEGKCLGADISLPAPGAGEVQGGVIHSVGSLRVQGLGKIPESCGCPMPESAQDQAG